MPDRKSSQNVYFHGVHIIHNNYEFCNLKEKLSGLLGDSYIETITTVGIHARMGIKNSLNPEIKIQHQPVPTGSLS